jgi:uncharacterized damage-inducible protein DinB
MKKILLSYCKYNLWANNKIVDLLKQLSEEDLDKDLGGSFKTIRQTLYHIWGAESIWMQRILMTEKVIVPQEHFEGTFIEACEYWLKVSDSFITFTEKQFDDRNFQHQFIYRNLKNENFKSEVWECIHHCMNHSTFHRGQLINYCRMLGLTKIPSTDMITFLREKK